MVWIGVYLRTHRNRSLISSTLPSISSWLIPKMQQRLADLGGVPMPAHHKISAKIIAAETAKWAKVVEASGAKVE
jgi:hypothetical protein